MIKILSRLLTRTKQPEHIRTGQWGEALAASMLKQKGCKILGTRVRFGRKYELDIVARNADTLIFVEVKTRKNEKFGRPIGAVDRKKRETISRAALKYLRKLHKLPKYIRFDVVEVVGTKDEPNPTVRHIENAFTLPARYRLPFKPS